MLHLFALETKTAEEIQLDNLNSMIYGNENWHCHQKSYADRTMELATKDAQLNSTRSNAKGQYSLKYFQGGGKFASYGE